MEFESSISKFLLNKTIRWICFFCVLTLTVIVYIQEPVRFSEKKSFLGITYKLHIFITFCITLFLYMFTFISLYVTEPLGVNSLPDYWFVPLFVFCYAILLHYYTISETVKEDDDPETLQPLPNYVLSRNYRYIFYYLIIIFDTLIFLQFLYASGITKTKKSTILNDVFLNKFGGFVSGNRLNFLASWAGIIGLILDFYMLYIQVTFHPCTYNLPNNWAV